MKCFINLIVRRFCSDERVIAGPLGTGRPPRNPLYIFSSKLYTVRLHIVAPAITAAVAATLIMSFPSSQKFEY